MNQRHDSAPSSTVCLWFALAVIVAPGVVVVVAMALKWYG